MIPMHSPHFSFSVTNVQIRDVDTMDAVLDMGFGISTRKTVRLMGIDGPEIRSKNELEKKAARYGVSLVGDFLFPPLEKKQHFSLILVSYAQRDKFGRVLGDFFFEGQSLCSALLMHQVVKPYQGGKKEPWKTAELKRILALKENALKNL